MLQMGYGVYQVETHVFNQQTDARKYMDGFDCRIMSWGQFAEGRNGFFYNPVLEAIGRKHGKSLFFDHHAPEVVKMFVVWR